MTDIERTWRNDAACRGEDPELFFSESVPEQRYIKRRICGNASDNPHAVPCPVMQECLAHAMSHEQGGEGGRHGVYGGLTPAERANMYRRQMRAARAS